MTSLPVSLSWLAETFVRMADGRFRRAASSSVRRCRVGTAVGSCRTRGTRARLCAGDALRGSTFACREAIRSPERSEPRRGRKGPSDADEIRDFSFHPHGESRRRIIPLKTKAVITIAAFQLRRLGSTQRRLASGAVPPFARRQLKALWQSKERPRDCQISDRIMRPMGRVTRPA